MKPRTYLFAISFLILLIQTRGLSQDNGVEKPLRDSKDTKTFDEDVRKVTPDFHPMDVAIDNFQLEADIDAAVENVFSSTELKFEDFDIDPIEIELSDLNLNHLEIDFDYSDIKVDQIEFEMEDLEFDINIDEDF